MGIESTLHEAISDLLKKHPKDRETSLYKSISQCLDDYTNKNCRNESIDKHKHLEKLAHIGHYEIDLQTGNVTWSDETFRIFGMDPETSKEPTIEEYKTFIHPEDQDKVYRLFERCIRESIEFNLTYRIIDKNKNVKNVHSIGTLRRNAKKMFGTFQDVSKQMRILQALEESETRYRMLADNSYDVVALFKNYELTYISPAIYTITGYSQQEFMKINLFNIIHPDDRERIEQTLRDRKANMKTGPITYEFRQKQKKGNYLWVQSVVNSYKAPSDKNIHSVMIIRDITEKKQQEQTLKEKEHFYRTILANIWDSVFLTDDFGNLTYICSNSRFIFGYNDDELKAFKTIQSILNLEPSIHDNLNIEDLHNSETTIKDKSGNEHHLLVSAKKVNIRNSKYLITCKDISDLKVIQTELALNEERFRTYFKEDGNIKLLIDAVTGKIVDASDRAVQFYGYPVERLTSMAISDINQLTEEEVKKEMERAKKKTKGEFHFKHTIASGQVRDVTVYSSPFTIHGQKLLLSTIFDVTEHLSVQRKLEESEKRFRMLFYDNASPMLIINPENGNIEEANESAARFYGYPGNIMTTLNISQINTLPPDELKEELQQSGKNGETHFYYRHKLANNEVRDVEVFSVRLKLNGHDSIHAIIHDITEKKRANELQQLLNERMEFAMLTNRMAWWEMDLPSGRVIFNNNKSRMLGYDDSEFKTYEDFMKLLHPDDYEPTMNAMQMHLDGKCDLYECEYRIQSKDKGYNWYRDVGKISHRYSKGFRVTGISKDISDYKRKEQELKESEEKFKTIFNNAPLGIFRSTPDGQFIEVNTALSEMLGYQSADEVIETITDIAKQVYVKTNKRKEIVAETLSAPGVIQYENVYKKKNGEQFIANLYLRSINDEKGNNLYLEGMVEDITLRRQMEEELMKREELLRITNDNITDVIWRLDMYGNFSYCSPSVEKLLGYKVNEVLGKNVIDFISHSDKDFAINNIKKREEKKHAGEIVSYQYKMVHKNGNTVDVEIISGPAFDINHEIIGYSGVTRDITKRKKDQQALKESEEKYKALYINAPLAYQSLDKDGNILDINPQWERVLGYKKKEVIGKWFGDFLHDEYVAHFKKKFPVFKKRGVIHDVQFRMKKKDGRFIHASFEGCVGYNQQGKFQQTYCTFKDVTVEHAISKKLKESEERFRKLIETMDEGVILVNPESVIIQHNQAALKILEVSTPSLAGIRVADFSHTTIHEDGTEFYSNDHPAMVTIRKNIPCHNVIMGIMLQVNTTKWLKINSEPFYLSENENAHALVSFTDISSLVENEKKLKESNATKDRFFSILAHDLKNPFNALLGFTELLMHNYDRYDAQKHKKYISLLNRSAKSAHLLLENLLIWSRSQRDTIAFNPSKTAIKPIIDLIIRQHESGFIAKSISVSEQIEPDTLTAYADIEMLKTVLRNLISNAIKFTPEDGTIIVSCTESETDTVFSVKDSGTGIKKEDQKKLFQVDSTFTTEGTMREKGTGLGLILCKDFVERHGGKISVASKKESGATFAFNIPKKS